MDKARSVVILVSKSSSFLGTSLGVHSWLVTFRRVTFCTMAIGLTLSGYTTLVILRLLHILTFPFANDFICIYQNSLALTDPNRAFWWIFSGRRQKRPSKKRPAKSDPPETSR